MAAVLVRSNFFPGTVRAELSGTSSSASGDSVAVEVARLGQFEFTLDSGFGLSAGPIRPWGEPSGWVFWTVVGVVAAIVLGVVAIKAR